MDAGLVCENVYVIAAALAEMKIYTLSIPHKT
jgi:hypothetical protein